jgi:hypothetical protein
MPAETKTPIDRYFTPIVEVIFKATEACLTTIWVLVCVAACIAPIWVVVHFIIKYW